MTNQVKNFGVLFNRFFEEIISQTFDIDKDFFMKVVNDIHDRITLVDEINGFMNSYFFLVTNDNQRLRV